MSSVGFTHRRNSCWLTLSCCNELNESLRKNFSKLRTQLRVFLFMNIYFTRFNQLINLIREICDFNRRRHWHPTPVLLPGKSHGRRSLVGCSPWGREEADTTERLPFHFTFMHWRRKWQPTPVFLPGESQGRGSLVGCHLWGHTESDMTEAT